MRISTFDISSLYLIEKKTIVRFFLYSGMLLAYFGSLNPWFLWPLGALYIVPACCLIVIAMLISNSMEIPIFVKRDFLPAILSYIILLFYQLFVNGASVAGFIVQPFNIFVFLALFRLSDNELSALVTFIAKTMAVLLLISIPCFLLYLFGFPFSSSNTVFGENALYSFTNYYFFMINDNSLFSIFPRFSSVFLEPGHLGTATVLLLLSQMGKWKMWYNVVLIVATLLTFSLAAYVLFIFIIFFNLWCQRKNIIRKALISVLILSSISIGAFFYNGGNNLLHDLILIRLEFEDGKMVGDNRVTDDFQAEFDDFLQSSDIFLGREMDLTTFGNSGFRVFIYENGLIGLLLVIIFYGVAFSNDRNWRVYIATIVISTLCFIVRGYPLWYNYFIPLYCTIYMTPNVKCKNKYDNFIYT